ncbi:MAG TPA: sugar transferase [Candidatus Limnocylindria bacterium]|nr:sugar transferase [Candidatus Limnocylindria bacterium]
MSQASSSPVSEGGSPYRRYGKRALDVALALVLSLPAALLTLLAAAAVKAETGGPVFFVQRRPGLGGKPFDLYKLRTMAAETHRDGRALSDHERMTRSGRVIRALSLDELPQLYNILRGDMSFVGPRPLLMQYLPLYTREQARRHEVRPGISGWAQVNGRNALSWEEKFRLDVWYADHLSLGLDLRIMGLTVLRVLKGEGVNQGADVTMRPCEGSVNGTGRGGGEGSGG